MTLRGLVTYNVGPTCHHHLCALRLFTSCELARWQTQGCHWWPTGSPLNNSLALSSFWTEKVIGDWIKTFCNRKIFKSSYFFLFWTFLVFSLTGLPFKSDWLFTDCSEVDRQSIVGNNQASVSWPQPTLPLHQHHLVVQSPLVVTGQIHFEVGQIQIPTHPHINVITSQGTQVSVGVWTILLVAIGDLGDSRMTHLNQPIFIPILMAIFNS